MTDTLTAILAEHWPETTGQATVYRCSCGAKTEAVIPDYNPIPDLTRIGREKFAEHVAEVIWETVVMWRSHDV